MGEYRQLTREIRAMTEAAHDHMGGPNRGQRRLLEEYKLRRGVERMRRKWPWEPHVVAF